MHRCAPSITTTQTCCPPVDTPAPKHTMQLSMRPAAAGMRCSPATRPAAVSSARSGLAGLPLAHTSARVQQQQRHFSPPQQQQQAAAAPASSRRSTGSSSRRSTVSVQAQYRRSGGGGGGSPDVVERVLAAVPYLLPFLDSLGYGRFLFFQYPAIRGALAPLAPLISIYSTVPFAPFVAFFAVYLGIINNQRWPRFVRFNAMQAVLLDILLILPRLVEQVFSTPTGGPLLQAYIIVQNTIFIFVACAVLYGIGASLTGQTARIPLVADAAEQQVR